MELTFANVIMFIAGTILGFIARGVFDNRMSKSKKREIDIKEVFQVGVGLIVLLIYANIVQNSLDNNTSIPFEVTGLVGIIVGSMFPQNLFGKNTKNGRNTQK